MQNSKRIQRILKNLKEIQDDLEYYTNGTKEYKQRFREIRELIDELGLEKKEDRAKFAKKLKELWKVDEEV